MKRMHYAEAKHYAIVAYCKVRPFPNSDLGEIVNYSYYFFSVNYTQSVYTQILEY